MKSNAFKWEDGYVVAINCGTGAASGREYISVEIATSEDAKGGTRAFLPDGDIKEEILALVGEVEFADADSTPNRYKLTDSYEIGKVAFYSTDKVPAVKQHYKDRNTGDDRVRVLTTVSGVAIAALAQTPSDLIDRELIRRCNSDDFSPVKGQDYSRYRFADTTWEAVERELFGDDEVIDDEE